MIWPAKILADHEELFWEKNRNSQHKLRLLLSRLILAIDFTSSVEIFSIQTSVSIQYWYTMNRNAYNINWNKTAFVAHLVCLARFSFVPLKLNTMKMNGARFFLSIYSIHISCHLNELNQFEEIIYACWQHQQHDFHLENYKKWMKSIHKLNTAHM